jgi:N-glycosylase/DNA lyase
MELSKLYSEKGEQIRKRLNDFKFLSEEEMFKEFMFCLLTPQSNAQRCWQAVEEISALDKVSLENVTDILSKRTRFHHTKAKRILMAREKWKEIRPLLDKKDVKSLRNEIAQRVNGYGLKEAGHFLRNIGLSRNEIAILDRHILRNLGVEKIKNKKDYFKIEDKFLDYAESVGIPADELDLLWWSKENGEVFK